MIPDKIYEYCQSNKSVTSELAESPDKSPGEIARKLYGKHEAIDDTAKDALQEVKAASSDELEKAFRCGKWGATRPSDLFLQVGQPNLYLPLQLLFDQPKLILNPDLP